MLLHSCAFTIAVGCCACATFPASSGRAAAAALALGGQAADGGALGSPGGILLLIALATAVNASLT